MTDITGWVIDTAQNKLVLIDNNKKIVVVGIEEIDDFLSKYANTFRIYVAKTNRAATYIDAWNQENPVKALKIEAAVGFRNYAAKNTKVDHNNLILDVSRNELILVDRIDKQIIVAGIDEIDQFLKKYSDKVRFDLAQTAAAVRYQDAWDIANPEKKAQINAFINARNQAQIAATTQKAVVDPSSGTVLHTDTATGTTSTADTKTGTVAVTTPTGQTVTGTGSVTAGGVTTTVNPVTKVVTTQNPNTGVTTQTNGTTGQTVTTAQVAATSVDAGKLALIGLVGLLLLRGAIK